MKVSLGLVCPLVLALTACGSGGGSSENKEAAANGASAETAKAEDPCRLVSADEVGAIIGDKIVATKPAEGSCTYETADAQASTVMIEINTTDAKGQMDIARRTAGFLKGMGSAAADKGGAGADVNQMLSDSGDAPKVGDEAFFGPNQQLSVLKGGTYLAISPPIMRSRTAGGNPLLSSDKKKEMAVAVAEKAVSRLP